jgi:small-conductance mechanosensitive channel
MLMLIVQKTLESTWEQIGQAYTNVWLRTLGFLPEIGAAIFVIVFTMLTSRTVRKAVSKAMAKTKADPNVQFIVVRIAGLSIWLIGLSVILSVLKVDAGGIFAALGLTGAAIGFAVKDIIANFIAGIVLLSTRPFKIGDLVTIETFDGVVEDLAIRATILKTIDGKEVTIPNARVFNAVVIKHSVQSSRRVVISLGIDDKHPFEKIKSLVLETISTIPEVATEPAITVNISSFSGNSINIDVWFWVKGEASLLATSSKAKLELKEAFAREQIELSPPTPTMVLQSPPPK